jgi:hypothetical protein
MKRFNDYFAMGINERINFKCKYPYSPNILCSKGNKKALVNQMLTICKLIKMYSDGILTEKCFTQMHNKEIRNIYYNF